MGGPEEDADGGVGGRQSPEEGRGRGCRCVWSWRRGVAVVVAWSGERREERGRGGVRRARTLRARTPSPSLGGTRVWTVDAATLLLLLGLGTGNA